jgi:hypothetical protein|tara:strand:- start:642 stop:752 length:111 start_codon:yes stop_codon:yes gene_type:complete
MKLIHAVLLCVAFLAFVETLHLKHHGDIPIHKHCRD